MRKELMKDTSFQKAIDLYEKIDLDAYILNNDDALSEMMALSDHRDKIERLICYQQAKMIEYLVEKADPVELMGIRHALQALDHVLASLDKFKAEYERREVQNKKDNNKKSPVEGEKSL